MSDTRRTFIGKLLAAFSLPAWITKVWGKPSYQSSDVAFSKWKKANATPEIMPSMHVLDQTNGCVDFRSEMTQMEWIVKSSGRRINFEGHERIVPKGPRLKETPNFGHCKNLDEGWGGD